MNQTTDTLNPMQIIDIVKRRRWYLMLPFFASLIVGIVLAIVLPKVSGEHHDFGATSKGSR